MCASERSLLSKIATLETTIRRLNEKVDEKDAELEKHGEANASAQNDNMDLMQQMMDQSAKMREQ